MSWDDCMATVGRLDAWIGLITEAQWEYACRAGTATPWWTGAEAESLRGRENFRLTDTDGSANGVAESAAVGTTVGVTARATDADASDGVTYSLDDDAGGWFSIDAATGVMHVAGALDYESLPNPNVTVRATSSDGSTSTLVVACG